MTTKFFSKKNLVGIYTIYLVTTLSKMTYFPTDSERMAPWRTLANQEVILRIGPLAKQIEAM